MYYFTYPCKKMRLTQGYKDGNHKGHWYNATKYKDYPIDEAGKDGGCDPIYAPVDMKVIKVSYGTPSSNYLILQTTEKVKTPIGDKIVIMTITHPNDKDIKGIKKGSIIKKGKVICHEGNDGNSSGNHAHITYGTGTYKGMYKNNNSKWCFICTTTNKPEELVYINSKFTEIVNCKEIAFNIIDTDKVAEEKKILPDRGYFKKGDKSPYIGKVAEFMLNKFPAYTSKKALGDTYGTNLINSIKEFQKRVGLRSDGLLDQATLDKLYAYGLKL